MPRERFNAGSLRSQPWLSYDEMLARGHTYESVLCLNNAANFVGIVFCLDSKHRDALKYKFQVDPGELEEFNNACRNFKLRIAEAKRHGKAGVRYFEVRFIEGSGLAETFSLLSSEFSSHGRFANQDIRLRKWFSVFTQSVSQDVTHFQ